MTIANKPLLFSISMILLIGLFIVTADTGQEYENFPINSTVAKTLPTTDYSQNFVGPHLDLPPNPQPILSIETEQPKPETESSTKTTQIASKPLAQKSSPKVSNTCGGNVQQQFLCLLNKYRAQKGLPALKYDPKLESIGLTHSQWMEANALFSHVGIDGTRSWQRCELANYSCSAENLAKGVSGAQNLLTSWQNSSTHNANLLRNASYVGLGISGPYATLLFK